MLLVGGRLHSFLIRGVLIGVQKFCFTVSILHRCNEYIVVSSVIQIDVVKVVNVRVYCPTNAILAPLHASRPIPIIPVGLSFQCDPAHNSHQPVLLSRVPHQLSPGDPAVLIADLMTSPFSTHKRSYPGIYPVI